MKSIHLVSFSRESVASRTFHPDGIAVFRESCGSFSAHDCARLIAPIVASSAARRIAFGRAVPPRLRATTTAMLAAIRAARPSQMLAKRVCSRRLRRTQDELPNPRSDANASRLRVRRRAARSDGTSLRQRNRDRKSRALRTTQSFFHQILLAALLKLCNAAENFLRDALEYLAKLRRSRRESKLVASLAASGDTGFAAGFILTVESPVVRSSGRALLCLLL
jgi:hypothetical protein